MHYERDHDLRINGKAASRGGTSAATLLLEPGIDGYPAHGVRLDVGSGEPEGDPDAFRYALSGDEVRAPTDAIEALTAVRDLLSAITG